ncbi:hypothetical protein C2845_PM09G00610 [Panicum miliaceum]|uniref:Uncharacterized protein n=1 Tax=Panicum miliaceum TaxID=4540 RepID=A0A3L6S1F6_PANMI|nr:hypothetical protein C2845_PM09G00610 [Panicum miliaceum]
MRDRSVAGGPREQLRSRAILHDGRLARRPTATNTLLTFLWMSFGFALALLRAGLHLFLPPRSVSYACKLTGIKLVVRGHPPPPPPRKEGGGPPFLNPTARPARAPAQQRMTS